MERRSKSNLLMPKIGYGTWKLKDKEETIEIVKNAIEVGYRLIDTASAYGNLKVVGKGIKESKIKREELFITSKCWNDSRKKEDVIKACKNTIKELGCKYLDLYLIHWPASPALYENWKDLNNEMWEAFEELQEEGFVKAIGVCNFKVHQLEPLLEHAKIKPMVNQIEYHIGQTQKEIVDYCNKNNILVEAWSPLGAGKMLKVEELQKMAEKYNISTAQLCIKFCIQNNVIPIPKSKDKDRMRQNLQLDDFTISKEDMEILNNMPYLGGSGLDSDTITLFG